MSHSQPFFTDSSEKVLCWLILTPQRWESVVSSYSVVWSEVLHSKVQSRRRGCKAKTKLVSLNIQPSTSEGWGEAFRKWALWNWSLLSAGVGLVSCFQRRRRAFPSHGKVHKDEDGRNSSTVTGVKCWLSQNLFSKKASMCRLAHQLLLSASGGKTPRARVRSCIYSFSSCCCLIIHNLISFTLCTLFLDIFLLFWQAHGLFMPLLLCPSNCCRYLIATASARDSQCPLSPAPPLERERKREHLLLKGGGGGLGAAVSAFHSVPGGEHVKLDESQETREANITCCSLIQTVTDPPGLHAPAYVLVGWNLSWNTPHRWLQSSTHIQLSHLHINSRKSFAFDCLKSCRTLLGTAGWKMLM